MGFFSEVFYKLNVLLADTSLDSHFVALPDLAECFFLATFVNRLNLVSQDVHCHLNCCYCRDLLQVVVRSAVLPILGAKKAKI